jgi:hypothetical protein
MERYSRKINDSLALLIYLDKNHPKNQSTRSLAEAIGTSQRTMRRILDEAYRRKNVKDSILHKTAYKYGFQFQFFNGWRDNSGRYTEKAILDAVWVGFNTTSEEDYCN